MFKTSGVPQSHRMLTLSRHYLLAFALSLPLAACAGSESTSKIEEPVESDEDDDDGNEARDAGRPNTRIDAGKDANTPKPEPKNDASTTPRDASTTPRDATVSPTDSGPAPNPFAPGDRTPSPDNIPECPKVAPENPIGDCLGIPVYAVCSYTTYTCVCDWYHWLCI